MKNLCFIFIFSFINFWSFSQNSREDIGVVKGKEIFLKKKSTLSLSLVNTIIRDIQVSYERKFKDRNSFLILSSILFDNLKKESYSYVGTTNELHYRRYIYVTSAKGKIPNVNSVGIYVSALAGYHFFKETLDYSILIPTSNEKAYQYINSGLYGLLAGFNINIIKGRLAINTYGGIVHKISYIKEKGRFGSGSFFSTAPVFLAKGNNGFLPKINFQLGFNF